MLGRAKQANPKSLFIVAAALTSVLGVAFVFFPESMLVSWGTRPDALAVYMAQRYGAMFFGYAPILWLIRAIPASSTRTAVLTGLAVAAITMTIISTIGVFTGVVGLPATAAIIVEALLASAALYFLSMDMRQRRA